MYFLNAELHFLSDELQFPKTAFKFLNTEMDFLNSEYLPFSEYGIVIPTYRIEFFAEFRICSIS